MRRRVEWAETARVWFKDNEREIRAGLDRGNVTGEPTEVVATRGKRGELAWSSLYRIPVDMSADIETHKRPDAVHPKTGAKFDVKTRRSYLDRPGEEQRLLWPIYMFTRMDAVEQHPDYLLHLVIETPTEIVVAGGIRAGTVYGMAIEAKTQVIEGRKAAHRAFASAQLPVFMSRVDGLLFVNVRQDLLTPLHAWERECNLEPDLAVHARNWP